MRVKVALSECRLALVVSVVSFEDGDVPATDEICGKLLSEVADSVVKFAVKLADSEPGHNRRRLRCR